ncbi:hypothetical protein Rhe02_15810 [Rhizocola hellebori]|uniref:Teneurin-1 n=1 Tax=Rhizocola hellebori TaxID=1392758 RepID=A0A8J3Q4Y2_9ACTN|nr:LamG-like jellyroll fold domain-containing protein [Rhizocola hellebori]GIH03514.1 hypothetical protein Rhe02_15810 [Rhizocola hellebori]
MKLRGVGFVVAVVLGLTVAVPLGQPMPEPGRFPLAGLWEALTTRPAWSMDRTTPATPKQERGGPTDVASLISGDKTTAAGGSGRPRGKGTGELADFAQLQAAPPKQSVTGSEIRGFEPATSQRSLTEATRNSDLFRNTDGTTTRRISAKPVNFKASDGSWRSFDATLVPDGDRWRTKSSEVQVSLAGSHTSSAELAILTLPGGQELAYDLRGAARVDPVVSGSTAKYLGVMPGLDIELSANSATNKETLILHSKEVANSWVFPLRLKGLRASIEKNGSVVLRDDKDAVVARIPRGWMQDSKFLTHEGDFVKSDAVTYELIDGGTALKVTADRKWLDDPARVYPVRVDPTTTFYTDGDVFVDPDPSTGASAQNGSSLAIGWDGDYVGSPSQRDVKYSYIHFDDFPQVVNGMRVQSATLKLFHTWSPAGMCDQHRPFTVHMVTQPWSAPELEDSSTLPGQTSPISTGTITDHYPACTNSGGNRSVGKWAYVSIDDLRPLNAWAHGASFYGIALQADGTDHAAFKRFTSENYAGSCAGEDCQPQLIVTYAADTRAHVDDVFPASGYSSPTLTPDLTASASDAEGDPVQYQFRIYDSGNVERGNSGLVSSSSWTVPPGVLEWGKSYLWTVVAGSAGIFSDASAQVITAVPPQPIITSKLSQNGRRGIEPSIGNYTTIATDAEVTTVGPALKVERFYNSRDPRAGAFGSGWSSLLDAKIAYGPVDAGGTNLQWVTVTYPDGQDVVFGRRADGTYAPPPGRYATLRDKGSGVFELVDKQGLKLTFMTSPQGLFTSANPLLSAIEDPQGRALLLSYGSVATGVYKTVTLQSKFYQYDAAGTRINEWLGRKLNLTWLNGKVSSVATDRADVNDATSVSTWTYTYTGSRLTSVCRPAAQAECTQYKYGTDGLFPAALLATTPHTYLKLNETTGTTAASSVTGNPDTATGTYNAVTLGRAGRPGALAPAANFNGASSWVYLGNKTAFRSANQTVSMWFRASPWDNGVLFGASTVTMPNAASSGWNPILYIGVDGKLRGQVYTGAINPITTSGVVTDNAWHHVALTVAGTTQTMYLDGAKVGTLTGTVSSLGSTVHYHIGAGQWDYWTAGSGTFGYFKGSIADFGFHTTALAEATVKTIREAGATASNWLYPTAAHDASPHTYLRLGESGGNAAVSEPTDDSDAASGVYHDVALGQPGPAGSVATAAGFNGTSSWVELPDKAAFTSSYQSVAMWFKAAVGTRGVLFSSSKAALPNLAGAGWNPILYIGDDGKLYAELWHGSVSPIKSTSTVNDNAWHHVVLTVAGGSQKLYIDGGEQASRTGSAPQSLGAGTNHYYLGAGQWNLWHGSGGTYAGYLNGSISDFSFYTKPLTAGQVAALRGTGTASSAPLTRIVAPSGRTDTEVYYDASGVVYELRDENSGTWKISPPEVSGSDTVYAAAVLGGGPADYWRLGDTGAPSIAKNELNGGTATFNQVTLGDPGPFRLSNNRTAAKFDGTSSYLRLPDNDVPQAGPESISLWFKADPGNYGVLFSYQDQLLTEPSPAGWVPALYVGTDGKLWGFLWAPGGSNIASGVRVDDGNWHHAVLSASTGSQSLYLDGARVGGTVAQRQAVAPARYAFVGAGKWAGWPSSTGTVGYFKGSIAEVAYYRSELTAGDVSVQFSANQKSFGSPARTVAVIDPAQSAQMDPKPTIYRYDAANGRRLIEQTDPLGAKTSYGYDGGGFMRSTTDPLGNMTVTGHDVRGNTVSQSTCQNRAQNLCTTEYFTYYPDSTSAVLNPDPRNDLVLTVRGAGSQSAADDTYKTTFTYDARGNRTEIIDPLGRRITTRFTDGSGGIPAGLISQTIAANGGESFVSHSAFGDVTSMTEPSGLRTDYLFDNLGRLTTRKTIGSDTQTSTYKYDKQGRVIEQTDPATVNALVSETHTLRSFTKYDSDGRVYELIDDDITGTDPDRKTTFSYGSQRQVETVTDPAGKVQRFEYDRNGRVAKHTATDGVVTGYGYDDAGRQTSTKILNYTGDPNSPMPPAELAIETRVYDLAGRLAAAVDAEGFRTEFTYTGNGLLVSQVRKDPPPGAEASFTVESNVYNAAGQLTRKTTNNGTTTTDYTPDRAGRLTDKTLDPTGLNRKTTYDYNLDDSVRTKTISDAATGSQTIDSIYDIAGRKIRESVSGSGGAPTGPAAWWKMDNFTGSTTLDSTLNRRNLSACCGNVQWPGDGSVNLQGGLLTAGGPVLDTTQSFTVSAWAKPPAGSGGMSLISQDMNFRSSFDLYYAGGTTWGFTKPYGDGNWGAAWVGGSTPYTQGDWVHVVGVYDAGAGAARLYLNGVLVDTQMAIAGESFPNQLVVGRSQYGGAAVNWFQGGIDNIQLYPRAVSAAEVSTLLSKGRDGGSLASDLTKSWTYNQRGQATSAMDPSGNITRFTYDAAGRMVQTESPAVTAEEFGVAPVSAVPISRSGFNTFGELVDAQDPKNRVVHYNRDLKGQVYETKLPTEGGLTPIYYTEYDDAGRVRKERNPLLKETNYVYDQMGRLAKITLPSSGVSSYTYDKLGNVLSVTDPMGGRAEATYDYLGRPETSTRLVRQPSPAAYVERYAYHPSGWLKTVTSPGNVVTERSYNAAGEVSWQKSPAGQYTDYRYDYAGRPTWTFPPIGSPEKLDYDPLGRPTTHTLYAPGAGRAQSGALIDTESMGYDRSGNITSVTDFRDKTTTFTYDAAGSRLSQTEPVSDLAADSITTTFGYDLSGAPTRLTDGRGSQFWTEYNRWGLPISQIDPATAAYPNLADRKYTSTYDVALRVSRLDMPGGVSQTYTYDDMDQVKKIVGAGAESATVDRVFDYDLAGRMKEFKSGTGGTPNTLTYDDRGLLLSANGPSGNSSFGYNGDGQLTSRTDAAGTTSYGYTNGLLSSIANSGASIQLALTYNALGQTDTIVHGGTGNVRRFGYDDRHRAITDELKTSGGTQIGKITYGWDDNGNEISKTTVGFGASTANAYTYDYANRLSSWTTGSTTTAYKYDKSGNRTQAGSKTFSYNERNQLLASAPAGTTYQYSARGSLKSSTTGTVTLNTQADAFDQVIRQYSSATVYSQYSYDALGRATATGFAYSGLENDLAKDAVATYSRDPSGNLVGVKQSTSALYAWTDLHGDVVGQYTATGTALAGSTVYDPLGRVLTTATMKGNLGYQSEWTDLPTGRVNMHARWYNTDTGQFDSRDTATNPASPSSAGANRYAYAGENPLTRTDPSGHHYVYGEGQRGIEAGSIEWWCSMWSCDPPEDPAVACKKDGPAWCFASGLISNAPIPDVTAIDEFLDQLTSWDAAWGVAKEFFEQMKAEADAWGGKLVEHFGWMGKLSAPLLKVAGWICVLSDACDTLVDCFGSGDGSCWYRAGEKVGQAIGSFLTGGGKHIAGRIQDMLRHIYDKKHRGSDEDGGNTKKPDPEVDPEQRPHVATDRNRPPEERGWDDNPTPDGEGGGGGGGTDGGDGGGKGDGDNNPDPEESFKPEACDLGDNYWHSFDPATPVLMADGSAKAIGDIEIGEKVVATDPVTGETSAQPVTSLHVNLEEDLTNVTVGEGEGDRSTRGPTTLETTDHHPFWDASTQAWVDAAELIPGRSKVVGTDGETLSVVAVESLDGAELMRDLTVANVHTYYVVAGDSLVLVHNCTNPPKVHGNSNDSPAVNYLYALVAPESRAVVKWGISDSPLTRYSKKELGNLQMVILEQGGRREMKSFETWLVSRFPGQANKESYSGSLWPSIKNGPDSSIENDWDFIHWFTNKHDLSIPDLQ